jgi:hypothetical protein
MANRFELQLSAAGLRNVASAAYENTFRFVVSGRCYYCKPFIADFLSPKLGRAPESDPTIDTYVVLTPDSLTHFGDFLSLGEGGRVEISSTNRNFLLLLGQELENSELVAQLLLSDGDVTLDNAVPRFRQKRLAGLSCEGEVEFLGKLFAEAWDSIQEGLNAETIHEIVSSVWLKIPSEDWLPDQLMNYVSNDVSRMFLLETVYFEMISCSVMEAFTKFASQFYGSMTFLLWQRLCARLICEVHPPSELAMTLSSRFSKQPGRDICYESGKPFDGIISSLTSKYGGNLDDLGVVKVTESSMCNQDWAGKHCIDHRSEKAFCSQNQPGQWLQLDFGNAAVCATHYSIFSRRDIGKDSLHPKSWVVEVSEDGKAWTIVDRRDDNSDLNGQSAQQTFTITDPKTGRYLRLRQTGPNHRGDNYFSFTKLELFGRLNEPSSSAS